MADQPSANQGIGIVNFLKHKNYFVVGSTGFTGKASVFIEKLLREIPEVQKIYLLLRAKNVEAAAQRLKTEIIDCEIFIRLKNEHGARYEEFMKGKLVAVVGNITDHPYLGMDANLAHAIANQIDVIVNIAADTRWHARYDVLLDVNVRGISRLLAYAMNCKKLLLLLHVSIAFATRKAVGVVQENPIVMEKSKLRRENSNSDVPDELDIKAEVKIVDELLASGIQEYKLPREMIKLGMRRTKMHGYSNTYILTKVMGEMLVSTMGEKLPTVIIRPSFIGNSLKEPFAGWIEKYRGMDPMILSYGEGQLQGILADPNGIIDIVPVDILANAMIVAIANHAISGELGIHVYHVASSMVKPILFQTLFKYCCNYFTLHPFKNSRGEIIKVEEMEFHASLDEYILAGMNSKPSNNDKLYSNLVRIAAIYEPILFLRLWFNNTNAQNLFEAMSSEEKKKFNFDVNCIDWEEYFMNIQLRGLTKHILKKKYLKTIALVTLLLFL